MADAVDTLTIRNSVALTGKLVQRFTNLSDGTGESGVTKVDISTFTTPKGSAATYSVVDRIEYNVNGMTVALYWDHTTDDEIAVLGGSGVIDASVDGGRVDPRSSGGTGDILLTTTGHTSGDSYDITIYMKLKT